MKKDQQWKFPKKIAFKFASGRRWNVIRSLFVVSCEATGALRFLFGHGNSVEFESLELELEFVKTFARHMLLGE